MNRRGFIGGLIAGLAALLLPKTAKAQIPVIMRGGEEYDARTMTYCHADMPVSLPDGRMLVTLHGWAARQSLTSIRIPDVRRGFLRRSLKVWRDGKIVRFCAVDEELAVHYVSMLDYKWNWGA